MKLQESNELSGERMQWPLHIPCNQNGKYSQQLEWKQHQKRLMILKDQEY
jgi:hypothetical protein